MVGGAQLEAGCSSCFLAHVGHAVTNCFTSLIIDGQQHCFLVNSGIQRIHGRQGNFEKCIQSSTLLLTILGQKSSLVGLFLGLIPLVEPP